MIKKNLTIFVLGLIFGFEGIKPLTHLVYLLLIVGSFILGRY